MHRAIDSKGGDWAFLQSSEGRSLGLERNLKVILDGKHHCRSGEHRIPVLQCVSDGAGAATQKLGALAVLPGKSCVCHSGRGTGRLLGS